MSTGSITTIGKNENKIFLVLHYYSQLAVLITNEFSFCFLPHIIKRLSNTVDPVIFATLYFCEFNTLHYFANCIFCDLSKIIIIEWLYILFRRENLEFATEFSHELSWKLCLSNKTGFTVAISKDNLKKGTRIRESISALQCRQRNLNPRGKIFFHIVALLRSGQ